MGLEHGSGGRAFAKYERGPEFDPRYRQKKKNLHKILGMEAEASVRPLPGKR
jgi:hypothetical protein